MFHWCIKYFSSIYNFFFYCSLVYIRWVHVWNMHVSSMWCCAYHVLHFKFVFNSSTLVSLCDFIFTAWTLCMSLMFFLGTLMCKWIFAQRQYVLTLELYTDGYIVYVVNICGKACCLKSGNNIKLHRKEPYNDCRTPVYGISCQLVYFLSMQRQITQVQYLKQKFIACFNCSFLSHACNTVIL